MSERLQNYRVPLAVTAALVGAFALTGCSEASKEEATCQKNDGRAWSSNMNVFSADALAKDLGTTVNQVALRGVHGMVECDKAISAEAVEKRHPIDVSGVSEDCLAVGFAGDSGFDPSNPNFASRKIWAVCLLPEAS